VIPEPPFLFAIAGLSASLAGLARLVAGPAGLVAGLRRGAELRPMDAFTHPRVVRGTVSACGRLVMTR
jgi:hypothetical protein